MIGSTISHYRIVAKLGEGGMGEVYRAEDATLGRTVALKFLAAHLLHDSEAKQRFLREARAAAALHHPNICTVFEVAEEDGKTFLAMAYLEGESLEDRIARGPLPLKDALEIGRQIAEGLEAAHEKGVVHRDIKPANVMVDTKGRATILDFGLARLTEASKLTRADQTVGTAAYMSPEQIQGADVDHRTDVWALGCTLYEMVAGVRPFKGQYDQALAYEILNEEPEPLTGVRSGVPMELEFIVGKCLARDVADRYGHADEIGRDLRTLADKLKSGRSTVLRTAVSPPHAGLAPGAAGPTPIYKRSAPWAILAAILALALAAISFLYFGQNLPDAPVAEFAVPVPEGSTLRPFSLSPDGRHLVMQTASGHLWVRSVDSVEPRELAGTAGATYPFWSPDARFIGFFAEGKLKRIPLAGGPAQSLCDAEDGRGGSWSPDGIILFAPQPGVAIHSVNENGGEPVAVASASAVGARYPQILPDGRHFVYLDGLGADPQEGVFLGSIDGGEPRRLLGEVSNIVYVPGSGEGAAGYLLFVREGTLMAQPFDADRLAFSGDVFPIAEQIGRVSHRGFYGFSASATAGLAYSNNSALHRPRQLMWLSREGKQVEAIGDPDNMREVSLSPDNRRAAVTKLATGGLDSDLWLVELARGTFNRFTSLQEQVSSPVWSPAGDTIAFSVGDHVRPKVYQKDTGGGSEAKRIAALEALDGELRSWSPDGRWLSALRHDPAGGHDVWILSVSGEGRSFAFFATEFEENQGHFSPDGKWVAYMSDKSGTNDVYLTPFPKAAREWKISTAGGREPRWRGDGKELYFIAPDGTLMAVSVRVGETVELGSPSPLFKMDEFGGSFDYDVAKDGQRFLVLVPSGGDQPTITVTTNWLARPRR